MGTTNGTRADGKLRVFLVDDHELVREGLAELVNKQPDLECCGEAADLPTALEQILEQKPDLAVVDLVLESGSGLELIKRVKAGDPSIKMLVCSMHEEALFGERVLAAGALGFVSKQEPSRIVLEAMRSVLSGRIYAGEEIVDRFRRRSSDGSGKDGGASMIDALSDRELEVLELLGDGQNTREIAGRLELSTKTIDTYREHIKTKLGLKNASELLRFAVAWRLDPASVSRSENPED